MKKKFYVKPTLTTIPVNYSHQLLAGSPDTINMDLDLNNAVEGSPTEEVEADAKLWKDTNLWED